MTVSGRAAARVQQDEPIGDPACLPMHFVAQAAKKRGVTVVLVGEGSDEVFGGYPDMTRLIASHDGKWRRMRRLPRAARRALYHGARAGMTTAGPTFCAAWPRMSRSTGVWMSSFRTSRSAGCIGLACTRPGFARCLSDVRLLPRAARHRPDADFLQQMSCVELSNRLPELLLMRVDKFSMAHSLEARAPFWITSSCHARSASRNTRRSPAAKQRKF